MRFAHRLGAVFYALWGLLHVLAGYGMLVVGPDEKLELLTTRPLPDVGLPGALAPVVDAGLAFHAYNLLWFGLVSLIVAVTLNWRNSRAGYWVNLVLVGFDDLGLIVFLILPGHLTFAEAGLGPLLYLLALLFSTLGRLRAGDSAVTAARTG